MSRDATPELIAEELASPELRAINAARLLMGARAQVKRLEAELELTRRVEAGALATLEELTTEGEAIEWEEGEDPLVRMPPAPVGRRSVLPGGLDKHRAKLEPLGAAPREEPVPPVPATTRTVYPSVADLDRLRDRLEAAGVPFDEVVEPRRYGPPRFLLARDAAEEVRQAHEREAAKAKHRRKGAEE